MFKVVAIVKKIHVIRSETVQKYYVLLSKQLFTTPKIWLRYFSLKAIDKKLTEDATFIQRLRIKKTLPRDEVS